jgi:hypothetical protein
MYVASKGLLLVWGILACLFGGALLTWSIFRAFRSWPARRANGSVAWTEPPLRIRPTKSLRGEPLLDPPPLRYYEAMYAILFGIVGLGFAALGVYFLLGAFGIVGSIYTNSPS